MTSKLIPPNPSEVMVIRKVTPNITTLSAPFSRFGRVKIGGRGTIVRLSSGALAVFSPVALTPEVKETVRGMGEVKYIAAPDLEHHIFLGPWHDEYPSAKVIGPEGLAEKRAKQKNENVPFSVIFSSKDKEANKVDPEFDADFDHEYVDAHPNKELVFNFRPDKTLIEADLLFNLPATEQYSRHGESPTSGVLTQFFNSINNTRGNAIWQKRLIWYAFSASNRTSFNASIAKINKWDFNRIIPCHGDVIETDGRGIFQKVMEWNLQAAQKK
ncbi:hypothetical protein EV356DRAFT_525048 [Viridothelium virens]|uniref:Uncharacterized protein n=1 Tax=Viridothelium virens TaxID=1048519 RepID=A0A6A6H3S4_VIRVR|nr:hypothetical protein EV356DRAFT_525048 [Viridothelium virens]